jgi:hypothetical protein
MLQSVARTLASENLDLSLRRPLHDLDAGLQSGLSNLSFVTTEGGARHNVRVHGGLGGEHGAFDASFFSSASTRRTTTWSWSGRKVMMRLL